MKHILFLFALFFVSAALTNTLAAQRPNIVIFLADDLGWADVGWHSGAATTGVIKTPNLDKLASQGITFEQYYVQQLCTPTRAALLTGRYPIRYGLQTGVIYAGSAHGLNTDERTLADALHESGYYTAITGKWHLGLSEKKYLPLQRGFDYHYGFYIGMVDYYTHERLGGLDWHRNGLTVREEGYTTELIANDAIKVIQNHNTVKPLFLYVPFNAVHSPFQEVPNEDIKEQYKDLQKQRKIYAGMVSVMDLHIGRIYKALETKGILDNTLIIFSSDNGGPSPKQVTDNGALRGAKSELYEGGVRVPAFAVWKGKIKPGIVSQDLIHVTDWYPTLLGLAGAKLEQDKPLDGYDLKEVLFENKPHRRTEILVNAEANRGALRAGDWKLDAFHRNDENPPVIKYELYNLKDDPNETKDLAELQPEKLQELLIRYKKYAVEAVPSQLKSRQKDIKAPAVWGEFD